MNKRQILVIFDGIIHEYLKAEMQFDTRNKPQIVKPQIYGNITKT